MNIKDANNIDSLLWDILDMLRDGEIEDAQWYMDTAEWTAKYYAPEFE